jgi:hypothetical protein
MSYPHPRITRWVLALLLCAAVQLHAQTERMDSPSLKQMLATAGYDVTDLASNKFTFTKQSETLNIPIAAEISPSGNYIWLTVNLTNNRPTLNHEALLKENAKIQPMFFYITSSGRLMMATALENRALTKEVVLRVVEKLIRDVQNTSSIWN